MLRKIMVLFLVSILALSTTQTMVFAEQTGFSDVSSQDWFYDAVMTLSEMGIISGYENGQFKPEEEVHRDAFATMMVKTLDLSLESPGTAWFKDVSKNHWAYAFVETAKYYMTGYKKNNAYYFMPETNAVREDMAVALVKAMGYQTSGNLSYLDTFEDADSISDNLKDEVATAVRYGLMSGSKSGDTYMFYPQSDLTRAETAALLMNILSADEDTMADSEKVTFDEMDPPSQNTQPGEDTSTYGKSPSIGIIVEEDGLYIEWSKVNSDGFSGYKVVASKSDSSPAYPENGYYQYITDIDTTHTRIKPYSGYNGGDIDSFESGQKYYFSITALYDDGKYPGNTISATMPGEKADTPDYITPEMSISAKSDHIEVSWSRIDHPKFQGYKVVASKSDSSPAYPENGYYKWITDKNTTSTSIYAGSNYNSGDVGKFESGQTYYFSITAVYSDKKVAGNVKRLTLP